MSRPSTGAVRLCATRGARAPASARSGARGSGTSASARRSRSRRASRSTPARRPAAAPRRPAARRGGARAGRPRAPARRGRRSAARRPRPRRRRSARPSGARGRRTRRRALHRVDEEVGDVDAVERAVEAGAERRVALDHLVDGGADARRRAAVAAHVVAVRAEAGDEGGADIAGGAGDEDSHGHHQATCPKCGLDDSQGGRNGHGKRLLAGTIWKTLRCAGRARAAGLSLRPHARFPSARPVTKW